MNPYTRTSPLPPLRQDISGHQPAPGFVALYDDLEYTDKVARLPVEMVEYLLLLDGERTAEFFAAQSAKAGRPFSVEDFLTLVNTLEQEYFLESERFLAYKKERDRAYNESTVRPAAHAGTSYPKEPEKLRAMLDGFLKAQPYAPTSQRNPVAVVAPHIDFRVGGASYGPAYNALRTSDADTFIIFGVSHQMSYDTFMLCHKDFETPLGTVPTDREFLEHFRSLLPFELTRNEIAHKREHSIEFQTVFLRHIFPDRDIKIVPILPGSLHEYVEFGDGNARGDKKLTTLYEALEQTTRDLGRKVCYIAGADLCHVGKKFGDDFPATTVLEELRTRDLATLGEVAKPDAEGFLTSIAAIHNRYRICGVAPIYSTLRAAKPTSGEALCYDQWDEAERESAVTFGSVVLW